MLTNHRPAGALPDTEVVNQLHPLRLGTVDVSRSVVHAGMPSDPWTVPLIAFLAIAPDGTPILIDNGFDADVMPRIPTRHTLVPDALRNALRKHGFEYEDVTTVINSHLHADHAGMNKVFTEAEIVVQTTELRFARTAVGDESHAYRPRSAFSEVPPDRFRFVDGDAEISPGIVIVHTPGHTPGHQAVAVHTSSGWTLLTGDACDDQDIWEGRQRPGIVKDSAAFNASLTRMRSLDCIPLWPHDLRFSQDDMETSY
jgi:glyoxylase-like metal-dependent hydrolase (beta-lactamase superfamily II)